MDALELKITDIKKELLDTFSNASLNDKARKEVIRQLVKDIWPNLPVWSTLDGPVIEEVAKASVGCGIVVTFPHEGEIKTLVAEAGAHYKPSEPSYMIPGGFITLTHTPGSSKVDAAEDVPEHPRVGAAREGEEEFKTANGMPLLEIDPSRLKPMDTLTLKLPWGEVRIVIGLMLELTKDEVPTVLEHVEKMEHDEDYRAAVAVQTCNPDTDLPEVGDVKIFPLADFAQRKVNLLHHDQYSLFDIVYAHYTEKSPRLTPTRSFQKKVASDIDTLADTVAYYKDKGLTVGVTSGVFDILHPGHVSFLEDARKQCDRLVVIIASDRTVTEQKGEMRPYITETKRAQTIAGLETVDAVIVSDSFYHENILGAMDFDVMFKGHDYEGQPIIGSDLVGRVEIIPCAEDNFYSSSRLEEAIKTGRRDSVPVWAKKELG